jgi:CIC family chloride channel protein
MNAKTIFEAPVNWAHEKLTKRQFLIFSSVLVGLTAGLSAVILKTFVFYIHKAIVKDYHIPFQYYLYLAFPVIGITLTVLFIKYFLRTELGKGTANILYAIAKKSGFLPLHQIYSHVVSSGLTVGFGGSAGLESPMVTTGSAIGSNFARTYGLSYKERVLLLASGAAAGIAAAFNSPIAGVLFALEVLLMDLAISAFIPLIIAAAVGALCSKIILHEGILLTFSMQQAFNYANVPFYILLGLAAGFVSVYYTRAFMLVDKVAAKVKGSQWKKVFWGGACLAVLILFFPTLFGEGYGSIISLSEMKPGKIISNSVLSGMISNEWFLLLFIGVVMLMKVIAASITINCGGNGGNFAPSLFVGAYLGYFFSRLINLLGIGALPESNFTIVAMAGILSGIFHAPLTAIFLIVEITGGYNLMIPLMIVSAFSFLIVKYFEPHSIDEKRLAEKGHQVNQNKDVTILSILETGSVIESDFLAVSPESDLGELVVVISRSHRNIFPVIDKKNRLVGIIMLDDVREVMFKHELYAVTRVRALMRKPPFIVSRGESMQSVMKKFDESGTWNLPVVEDGQYIGFISKSNIFSLYRKALVNTTIV